MPTDISNALGTARQFTPRPDATYRERLSGLSALQYSSAQFTNHALVAENLGKLTAAMQSYDMNNEKRQDEWGLEQATRLVNGSTAEDIAKLDVIDAAQQAGMLDVKDNPYFKAHAERLRGEFMATEARRAYDEKYAQFPAESADAEMARWDEFRTDYVSKKTTLPLNQVAFDEGFNKNGMVNRTMIGNKYSEKQIEEGMQKTIANTKAQLSLVNEQAPELLLENGRLTKAYQDILNEPRLAGLPAQMRYALAKEAIDNLVNKGRIDGERAVQMMEKVTIQTNMDGTRETLADVIDTFTIKTVAADYQNQHFTEYKHKVIEDYQNDLDMKRFYTAADAIRFTQPDNYKAMMQMASHVDSQQRSIKAKKAAEAQKAAKQSTTMNISLKYLESNYAAYDAGHEFDGSPEHNRTGIPMIPDGNGGFRSPTKEETLEFFKRSYMHIMDTKNQPDMSVGTRAQYWMKLFNYEPFSEIRNTYVQDYNQMLNGMVEIPLDAEGKPTVPLKTEMLVAAHTHDPAAFLNAFGKDVTQTISRLSRYASSAGSLVDGLKMLVKDNSLDPEIKQTYRSKISRAIASNGYSIPRMHTMGGGATSDAWLSENALVAQYAEDQAVFYMAQGYSEDGALGAAFNEIQDNSMYYHNAVLPRKIFSNSGTPNDEHFAKQVFDKIVYQTATEAGDVESARDVNVTYIPLTNEFIFEQNGVVNKMKVRQVKEQIKAAYDIAVNTGEPIPDVKVTADDMNNALNAYVVGVDEDRDTNGDTTALPGGD